MSDDRSSKNDLAQRLREAGTGYGAGGESLWFKAADEIERLSRERDSLLAAIGEHVTVRSEQYAQIQRLRAALERIASDASGGNRMSRADSNQFALGWLWGIASSAIIVLLIAVLRSCKP